MASEQKRTTDQVKLSFGHLNFIEQECKNDFNLNVQKVSKWQIHIYIYIFLPLSLGRNYIWLRANVLSKILAAPVSHRHAPTRT